jgi:hypothetical protein
MNATLHTAAVARAAVRNGPLPAFPGCEGRPVTAHGSHTNAT